jgi:UDP:flavonoid glycosyltransferase YjiC (YdhE family)
MRLDTYAFEDQTLLEAVDQMLSEPAPRARLSEISTRLQASPGSARAADLIERLIATGRPVTTG